MKKRSPKRSPKRQLKRSPRKSPNRKSSVIIIQKPTYEIYELNDLIKDGCEIDIMFIRKCYESLKARCQDEIDSAKTLEYNIDQALLKQFANKNNTKEEMNNIIKEMKKIKLLPFDRI